MRTRFKLGLVALASALLLTALVSSASANRLSQSESNFRIVYSPLSFVPSFGSTVRCPVTLEGSIHLRVIVKTLELLIGNNNRASVGTCEAGRMRVNAETLPWHIQISFFTGTLPNITSWLWKLIRWVFEIQGEIFGIRVTCRYTTPAQVLTNNRETTRGVISSQRPGTESTTSETEGCPSGRWSGTGSFTTPAGASIVLSLV